MFHPLIEDSSDEEFQPIVRRQRVYRPRQEYLNANDFRQRFRLMPWQAELLLIEIGPLIATQGLQRIAMTPKHKLMAALRFYASNNFNYSNGDAQGKF
jgi:hypothetical protein